MTTLALADPRLADDEDQADAFFAATVEADMALLCVRCPARIPAGGQILDAGGNGSGSASTAGGGPRNWTTRDRLRWWTRWLSVRAIASPRPA
jgi:hypothetical protein